MRGCHSQTARRSLHRSSNGRSGVIIIERAMSGERGSATIRYVPVSHLSGSVTLQIEGSRDQWLGEPKEEQDMSFHSKLLRLGQYAPSELECTVGSACPTWCQLPNLGGAAPCNRLGPRRGSITGAVEVEWK
jgi:hypothetical protein